jgi:hypothetical protein
VSGHAVGPEGLKEGERPVEGLDCPDASAPPNIRPPPSLASNRLNNNRRCARQCGCDDGNENEGRDDRRGRALFVDTSSSSLHTDPLDSGASLLGQDRHGREVLQENDKTLGEMDRDRSLRRYIGKRGF